VAYVAATPALTAAAAAESTPGPNLPTLEAFVRQVINGDGRELRGVYLPDLFAYRVAQQPTGYPSFVSWDANAVTQFAEASDLGSTGLLAHNFLAGRQFALMQPGQLVHLVYGDGRIGSFVVIQPLRYQALQPKSVHSSFEDLTTGEEVDASTLFMRIYGLRSALIFQTCIESDGDPNWGRLFVIARPLRHSEALTIMCRLCR